MPEEARIGGSRVYALAHVLALGAGSSGGYSRCAGLARLACGFFPANPQATRASGHQLPGVDCASQSSARP